MNRLLLSALCGMLFFCLAFSALAETVTEGRLDIQHLASQIAGDLQDYAEKRDTLIENIKSTQKGIQELKEDHDRAETEKEKIHIKARTLRETGRLVSFYSQFFNLNVAKVEDILPALEKMRTAAKKGAMGKVARVLQDPEFKKSMKNLYVNLATLATKFDNPDLKKEIASLLKENELLYQHNVKGVRAFDDIVRNIDKVADYLRSVYARTVLRARILEQKKLQTEIYLTKKHWSWNFLCSEWRILWVSARSSTSKKRPFLGLIGQCLWEKGFSIPSLTISRISPHRCTTTITASLIFFWTGRPSPYLLIFRSLAFIPCRFPPHKFLTGKSISDMSPTSMWENWPVWDGSAGIISWSVLIMVQGYGW